MTSTTENCRLKETDGVYINKRTAVPLPSEAGLLALTVLGFQYSGDAITPHWFYCRKDWGYGPGTDKSLYLKNSKGEVVSRANIDDWIVYNPVDNTLASYTPAEFKKTYVLFMLATESGASQLV